MPEALPRTLGATTDAATGEVPEGIRYRILEPQSELRILVMRGGPLARFGHNHVVGGPVIRGEIRLGEDLSDSSFELEIDLAAMEVDRPEWRREEGEDFLSTPDPEDIAGTRENMLGEKVLDVARFPIATARSAGILGQAPDFSVLARVTLKGKTRSIPVPVRMQTKGDRLSASGEFTLTQSDFGIDPFSVLLGAISVRDDVRIRFRIEALNDG